MSIEDNLLDAADVVAQEETNIARNVTADIACDESEQEFGVVMNAILSDYFGFGYNEYSGWRAGL